MILGLGGRSHARQSRQVPHGFGTAEFVAEQVIDVIGSKLIKRGIDLTAVKWGEAQARHPVNRLG